MTKEEIYKRADIYVSNQPLVNAYRPELKRGYCDGAVWMQNNHPLLKDVAAQKAIIVDTKWLEGHDKEMIWKACEWLKEHLPYGGDYLEDNILEGMTIDNIAKKLKQAMEDES